MQVPAHALRVIRLHISRRIGRSGTFRRDRDSDQAGRGSAVSGAFAEESRRPVVGLDLRRAESLCHLSAPASGQISGGTLLGTGCSVPAQRNLLPRQSSLGRSPTSRPGRPACVKHGGFLLRLNGSSRPTCLSLDGDCPAARARKCVRDTENPDLGGGGVGQMRLSKHRAGFSRLSMTRENVPTECTNKRPLPMPSLKGGVFISLP